MKLAYEGGSLRRPVGAVILDMDTVEGQAPDYPMVTFAPECFDADGAFKIEIMSALAQLVGNHEMEYLQRYHMETL